MELFLQLLFGAAELTEVLGHAVGDIKAAGAGVIRIQNVQSGLWIVEGQAAQGRFLGQLSVQRQQALQTLQVTLDLEQLHMIRHLAVAAATDGIADVLHLAQQDTYFIIHALELLGVVGSLPHII